MLDKKKKTLLWMPRPLSASKASAARLAALGAECHVEPLIERRVISTAYDALRRMRGDIVYIATSRYVFDLLAACDAPGFMGARYAALGEKSCAYAREKGFLNVRYAGETARDVLRYAVNLPNDTAFCYLSAKEVRLDVAEELRKKNRAASRLRLYENIPVRRLTAEGKALIESEKIGGVALYSVAMAESWLAATQVFNEKLYNIPHICISPSVAQRVIDLRVDCSILTAEAPTAEATERLAATVMK